jgi:hypothetical protein
MLGAGRSGRQLDQIINLVSQDEPGKHFLLACLACFAMAWMVGWLMLEEAKPFSTMQKLIDYT